MIKTVLFITISLILFSLTAVYGYSQQDSLKKVIINSDTVILGNRYFVATKYDWVIGGYIIATNERSILLKDNNEVVSIKKSDIAGITTEYPMVYEKNRPIISSFYRGNWSIGAGILYPDNGYAYEPGYSKFRSAENLIGFSIYASYTQPVSKYAGVRLDIDYSRINTGDNIYKTTYYNTSQKGGEWDNIALKFNVGFGNFNPEDKFNFNIFVGLGIARNHKSEASYYYTTYYINDSVRYSAIDRPAETTTNILACASIVIKYKFNKNFGVFLEPQVNAWSAPPNYFTIRTGIVF